MTLRWGLQPAIGLTASFGSDGRLLLTIYLFLDRPRSLILVGKSRTGKTEWARSLGRHVYYNGLFNLDDWDATAKYVIFDDFNIEFFNQYKAWFGAQKRFTVTDKYRKKKTITWGRPMIWIGNDDPRTNDKVDKEWMDLNSVYCFIHNKLY